jgi:hypothetical protein
VNPAGDDPTTLDVDAERAAFFAALDEDLDTPRAMLILDRLAGSNDPEGKGLAADAAALLGLDL